MRVSSEREGTIARLPAAGPMVDRPSAVDLSSKWEPTAVPGHRSDGAPAGAAGEPMQSVIGIAPRCERRANLRRGE
jgi:hypothetical protein